MVWLCGVLTLLPAVQAMAAMDAYMTITGSKQGTIKGGVAKEGGGEEQIRVTAVDHQSARLPRR